MRLCRRRPLFAVQSTVFVFLQGFYLQDNDLICCQRRLFDSWLWNVDKNINGSSKTTDLSDRFTLSPGVSDKILFVELIFCFLSKLFLQNLEWKLITRYETVPNSADVLCLTLRFISYHTDVSKVRMRYIYLHNRFAFDLMWELWFFLWLCRKLKHQNTFAWSHQQSSD